MLARKEGITQSFYIMSEMKYMGLLNLWKKRKPPLLSDVKKAEKLIIAALNSSGYKVDMTIDSLKEVERFFIEQLDDEVHLPKPGGLLSKNKGQRLFAIGSLVGEVVIKEYGGEWITNDNDPQGEINIAVKCPNGIIWPVQRVMKRCEEGPENDIYYYAISAGGK